MANLRKSLNDSPKSPVYVQTVPKQGYRFVAKIKTVSKATNTNPIEKVQILHNVKLVKSNFLTILSFFSFLILMSYLASSDVQPEPQYGHTQTLTRMLGVKQSPIVTQDQQAVLFINFHQNNGQLWKGALANTLEDAKAISTPFSSVTYLLGYDKSGQLVVRANKDGQCGWFKGVIEKNTFTINERSQLVCPKRMLRDNEYDADNDSIYFINHGSEGVVENSISYARFDDVDFEVASINLAKKWGASRFEIKEGDVVLLAHTAVGQSGIFTFKLSQINELKGQKVPNLTPSFTLPFRSNNIIWSHDKKGVVYSNAPPATKLFHQTLGADVKPKLVASFSDYICCNINRISGNDDYIFTTEVADFNIEWLTQQEGKIKAPDLNNSSSYDFIPTFANTSDYIYFLSKRTGNTQIYRQLNASNAEQVSDFKAYYRFYGLALSPDDNWITSFESKMIWLLSTNKNQADRVIPIDGHILSIDWLSEQLISVSIRQHGQFRVEIYNTQLQEIHSIVSNAGANINRVMSKKDGSRDVVAIVDEQILYNFKLSELFEFNDASSLVNKSTEMHKLYEPIRYSSAVIDQGTMYYLSNKEGQWFSIELAKDEKPKRLPFKVDRELTARSGRLLHSKLVHLSSEVHRTLAE